MDKREQAKKLLLDKCISFFDEMRNKESSELDEKKSGTMPRIAIIKYFDDCGSYIGDYFRAEPDTTWELEDGIATIVSNSQQHKQNPISGGYFCEASFFISWNSECEKAFLIYHMGPRYAAAWSYSLEEDNDGQAILANQEFLWMS